jgi:hypothetical protein
LGCGDTRAPFDLKLDRHPADGRTDAGLGILSASIAPSARVASGIGDAGRIIRRNPAFFGASALSRRG